MKKYFSIGLVVLCAMAIAACAKTNVFEKNIVLKNMEWRSADKKVILFNVEDTVALYNVFITLRHNDAYKYNNIWLNVYTKAPGDTNTVKQQLDLTLGNNDKGWLGSGMDDIFYHRIRITREAARFHKKGNYEFALEQIMRDDPLQNILNVGLRIEKTQ